MEIHPITIRELVHPGEILQTETHLPLFQLNLWKLETTVNNGEVHNSL